ncbi:hypothetical protein AB0R12_40220, partial [Streptomyces niveus]
STPPCHRPVSAVIAPTTTKDCPAARRPAALTTAYLIADEAAAPDARTQAGAWVNTALNAGISGGTALVGVLVGRLPLFLCFVLVAVPALVCAAVTLHGKNLRKRH